MRDRGKGWEKLEMSWVAPLVLVVGPGAFPSEIKYVMNTGPFFYQNSKRSWMAKVAPTYVQKNWSGIYQKMQIAHIFQFAMNCSDIYL